MIHQIQSGNRKSCYVIVTSDKTVWITTKEKGGGGRRRKGERKDNEQG